jgi:type IV fimbrial biogenesis protein FimT
MGDAMKQSGATLMELMVVLAVSAILLGVGIPSFASLAQTSRLSSVTNEMLSSLHLARSEAIKRNSRAVICPSVDGSHCAGSGDWYQGWLVFHDANNNAARDAGEAVVLAHGTLPQGISITGDSKVSKYISYSPTGGGKLISGAWQFGSLILCSESGASQAARKIIISSTGRPRSEKIVLESCP